jgi:two-component system, sensor histidine kinase LadS
MRAPPPRPTPVADLYSGRPPTLPPAVLRLAGLSIGERHGATDDDGGLGMRRSGWHRCCAHQAARLALLVAVLLAATALPRVAHAQSVRVDAQGLSGITSTASATAAPSITRITDPTAPLGRYARLFDETSGHPLALAQARARLAAGEFRASRVAVPNLGNRAPPLWMHLDIDNAGDTPRGYRIYAVEAWADHADAWLLTPDGGIAQWHVGDARSPSRYLRPGLGFGFDATLPPGHSELFLRADSIDSAALALRLVPQAEIGNFEGAAQHWLGLVHGFLLALVVTYGLLWLALREASLLRYVAYVGSYLYMHLAYSGIAALHVWPNAPQVADFAILVGMMLFSSAGLWFAREFLGLAHWAPRVDRGVAWLVRIALAAMVLCVVLDAKPTAVSLAFAYIMTFTLLMVVLGIAGVRHAREQAPIFLVASLASMVGAFITTMAVMGVLPFSTLTFRAVEVGVMLEASIWALALGLRLRRDREDRTHQMQLAQHDPLTGLCNRRGFFDRAAPLHAEAMRSGAPLSAILLDIDHFKAINDRHGHDAGDCTLVAIAHELLALCRREDILCRWGGEEFLVLLPGISHDAAVDCAERLRVATEGMVVQLASGAAIVATASFGVASATPSASLEDMLRQADAALYAAKQAGRNRVESTREAVLA